MMLPELKLGLAKACTHPAVCVSVSLPAFSLLSFFSLYVVLSLHLATLQVVLLYYWSFTSLHFVFSDVSANYPLVELVDFYATRLDLA